MIIESINVKNNVSISLSEKIIINYIIEKILNNRKNILINKIRF